MHSKALTVFVLSVLTVTDSLNDGFGNSQMSETIMMGVFEAVHSFVAELPQVKATNIASKNAIYDQIIGLLRNQLAASPDKFIERIGNESTPFEVRNAHIYGLDQIGLNLTSGSGYNIVNLTVLIPELRVNAENYRITNLNIGDLLTLNGDGELRFSLSNFFFTVRMDIKYWIARTEFEVTKIGWWEFMMDDINVDLSNLGGEGEALSVLLNGIANNFAPTLVRSLNNDIITAHDNAAAWAKFEGVVKPPIDNILNTAVKKFLP